MNVASSSRLLSPLGLSALLVVAAGFLGCERGQVSDHPPDEQGTTGTLGPEGGGEPEEDDGLALPEGSLVPSDVARDFLARQKLSGAYEGQNFSFEAVVQKRGDTLTVIGMTPFGTKAFVLTQTGSEVELEMYMDRELPFPLRYMLDDIHRAWLWDARLPWGSKPPPQERAEAEVAGERVVETWTSEGVVRRTFERLDGEPAGVVRIDYVGGYRIGTRPPTVILENGWYGYRLEIETVDYRTL